MDRPRDRKELDRQAAQLRPPKASTLRVCERCGCTTVVAADGVPYDPGPVERVNIWNHYGPAHFFAPAPHPWRPGHNCIPRNTSNGAD